MVRCWVHITFPTLRTLVETRACGIHWIFYLIFSLVCQPCCRATGAVTVCHYHSHRHRHRQRFSSICTGGFDCNWSKTEHQHQIRGARDLLCRRNRKGRRKGTDSCHSFRDMAQNRGSLAARLRSTLSRLYRGKPAPETPPARNNGPDTAMSETPSPASSPANSPGSPKEKPAPFICVPLYIYPGPSAWEPLVAAARARPSAVFHAIINPHNGPGEGELPDENYVEALKELAGLGNVRVIGYVHVTYGKREAEEVTRDIEKYAAWKGLDEGLRVDGVFFDEAPSGEDMFGYVAGLTRAARRELREANGEDGLVLLNPGVVVPRAYYDLADYIVAFEQAHGHWGEVRKEFMRSIEKRLRAKTVVMVHSCGVEEGELGELAKGFKKEGILGQYVTKQLEGGYSEWPPWWDSYVEAVFPGSVVAEME